METIDRSRVKDPSEVSGWGVRDGGTTRQDYSDIARASDVNAEFQPGAGRTITAGRADGSAAVAQRIEAPNP